MKTLVKLKKIRDKLLKQRFKLVLGIVLNRESEFYVNDKLSNAYRLLDDAIEELDNFIEKR